MKKITILAPLMLVPLLLACGNKSGGGSSVSEKEFNKAAKFNDVEYLQIKLDMTMSGDTLSNKSEEEEEEQITQTMEIAIPEKINHSIDTNTNTYSSTKIERYVKTTSIKMGATCQIAYKEDDDKDWQEEEGVVDYNFCVPLDYSPLAILDIPEGSGDIHFEPAVSYENFKLKNGKYVYEGQAVSDDESNEPELDAPTILELTFENKKLVKSYFNFSVNIKMDEEIIPWIKAETNMTFAYEEVIPTWPIA